MNSIPNQLLNKEEDSAEAPFREEIPINPFPSPAALKPLPNTAQHQTEKVLTQERLIATALDYPHLPNIQL